MSYVNEYCEEAITILNKLNRSAIEHMIGLLLQVRQQGGRLFFLGVGGSAANCSHAVNDFRKIGGFEAYTPLDNVSELTARTNDEGWHTVFAEWLKGSQLSEKDAVMVFSVGGGSKEKNISANLVYALDYAKEKKARIFGIVGRDGGYTAKVADVCVVIPPVNPDTVTPHTESFQAVVWHMIVSDPRVMVMKNKWESTAGAK
ncbi:MAG: SIS domain-containing protein [Candidatus Omnitrophota bacterium]|nr:SIS domain-containing protein [Candidatus Omnitrophota bacterium]MDZ4241233.1 SIS domain-containing protein [Candidatus Omnitrophota bacterium]